MTPEEMLQQSLLDNPPPPANVTITKSRQRCDKIVVTTVDGRTWDLGRPTHPLFKLRLRRYKWQRRKEI